VACYTHLLDMPNCRDCDYNDPHRLRAEIERLNRHLAQIHAALAERGETETEVWVMRALERAMQGEPA
jgi:hypothetical protein